MSGTRHACVTGTSGSPTSIPRSPGRDKDKDKPQLALGRPNQRNIWALVGQAMAEALLAAALEGEGSSDESGDDLARPATVTRVHHSTQP
jgi:hypothetical protein